MKFLHFAKPDQRTLRRAAVLLVVAILLVIFLWLDGYTDARHARQYQMYLRHQYGTVTTLPFDEQYPFPPHRHAPGTPEHTHKNAFDIEYGDGQSARDTRNGLVWNPSGQWWERP